MVIFEKLLTVFFFKFFQSSKRSEKLIYKFGLPQFERFYKNIPGGLKITLRIFWIFPNLLKKSLRKLFKNFDKKNLLKNKFHGFDKKFPMKKPTL